MARVSRGPAPAQPRRARAAPAPRGPAGAWRRRPRRRRPRRADPAGLGLPRPRAGARGVAAPPSRLPAAPWPSCTPAAPRRRATAAASRPTCATSSQQQRSPLAVIRATVADLGVRDDQVEPFLYHTALALPGWAGMFARLERHPEDHPGGPPTTLLEFMAVRLLFERRAIEHACRAARIPADWAALRALMPAPRPAPTVLTASLLWHVARAARLTPAAVAALDDAALVRVWRECLAFDPIDRRRHVLRSLRAHLSPHHPRRAGPAPRPCRSADRRSGRGRSSCSASTSARSRSAAPSRSSIPAIVTYGAAGFFGVAIDYQGLYDREPAAHCPVVVTPGHEVYEQPIESELSWHALRGRIRDALARLRAPQRRAVATPGRRRRAVVPARPDHRRPHHRAGAGAALGDAGERAGQGPLRAAAGHPPVHAPPRRGRAARTTAASRSASRSPSRSTGWPPR